MTKQLLAAAAALALLSGAAMAETYETTTSRTTTVAPTIPTPSDSYTQTRTESHVAPNGAAIETQQTYKSDLSGTSATSEKKVVRPDGSTEMTTSKQWSNSLTVPPPAPIAAPAPAPVPPTTSYTTTTTTVR